MDSPVRSDDDIRAVLQGIGPPGRPVTRAEIAAEFDSGDRSLEDLLEALVAEGTLETRSLDGAERVWWRPRADETDRAATVDAFRVDLVDTLRSLSTCRRPRRG